MTTQSPPLDAEHAAFIQGGVSIVAAARNADHETTVTRAVGCRVSADRRQVMILVSATQSAALLADIRANGIIAVVFSQPRRHLAIQLKGVDAAVVPLTDEDPHLIAAYRRRIGQEIAPIGYDDAFVGAVMSIVPSDVVAITFTPSAAFSQTPGPKAGAPLRSST
jgi:hypothetical protein